MIDSSAIERTDDTAGSTAGARFTPGPWSLGERNDSTVDINGKGAAGGDDLCEWEGLAKVFVIVGGQPDRVGEANARLISAAPDLYQGAIAFAEYLKAIDAGNDIAAMGHFNAAKDLLRLAMMKAEGR